VEEIVVCPEEPPVYQDKWNSRTWNKQSLSQFR